DPRATWQKVAYVLETSPVTVARRWERLTALGIAWTTLNPGPSVWERHCLAFISVDCETAKTDRVASTLAGDPWAASIEYTQHGNQLFLTVTMGSIAALDHYVRKRIGVLEGVRATSVYLASKVYADASKWHIGMLSSSEIRAIRARKTKVQHAFHLRQEDVNLMKALSTDVRRSFDDLSGELGVSTATVRRRLQRLFRADLIRMRCDVSH